MGDQGKEDNDINVNDGDGTGITSTLVGSNQALDVYIANDSDDTVETNLREMVLRETVTQDISAAALDYTTTFASDFRLEWISLNRDGGGGTNNFTVTYDSGDGVNFDTTLNVTSVNNDEKVFIPFEPPILFKEDDEINITFDSVGGSGVTLYITMMASER